MSTLSRFAAEMDRRTETQELINQIYGGLSADPPVAASTTRGSILGYLSAEYARYPQYDNHWSDFKLVAINRTITGRAGQILFDAGDVTLAKWEPGLLAPGFQGRWVAYSIRTRCNVSLGPDFGKSSKDIIPLY